MKRWRCLHILQNLLKRGPNQLFWATLKQILQNYIIKYVKTGVDTAANEPLKNWREFGNVEGENIQRKFQIPEVEM